jgi:hypothetical protein
VTAGAVTWAGARIEINIHDLNFDDPEENSTAQAREYMSQAQLMVPLFNTSFFLSSRPQLMAMRTPTATHKYHRALF